MVKARPKAMIGARINIEAEDVEYQKVDEQ